MSVHPTAIVAPGAKLHPTVEVGPYAVIGPQVTIGAGTTVGPHAVIEGRNPLLFDLGNDGGLGWRKAL